MSDSAADWHNKLLQLCTVFERVERNTILAVSLGKKLGSAPRLLAALTNHHLEPIKVPTTRVIVKKWSTTDEAKVFCSNNLSFLNRHACKWAISLFFTS